MTSAPSARSASIFSWLILSGIVKMQRYPLIAAASARPIPVLPDVPSMIVPPGLIFPAFSAASSIAMPMRSFTLPPGLRYSSFASIVGRTPCAMRLRRTIGVPPITSRMSFRHIDLRYHKHFLYPGFNAAEGQRGRRHWQVADVDVLHASLNERMDASRTNLIGMNLRAEVVRQFISRHGNEFRKHLECLRIGRAVIKHAENRRDPHTQTFRFVDKFIEGSCLVMRRNLRQIEIGRVFGMEHEFHLTTASVRVRPSAQRDSGNPLPDEAP